MTVNMPETTLISLLWPRQQNLLKTYLANRACLVYTLGQYNTENLQDLARAGGGRTQTLESLIGASQEQSLNAEAARRGEAVRAAFQAAVEVPEPWGSLLVPEALGERLSNSIRVIEMCDAALAAHPIEMLLISEEYMQIARTMALWAGKRGIPVVHVCHGSNRNRMLTVDQSELADVYALVGERAGDALMDLGIEENRLVPVGNAVWEAFHHADDLRALARKLLVEKHGLPSASPILVLGTTWTADLTAFMDRNAYDDTIRAFLAACQALRRKGIRLSCVIKDRAPNQGFAEERVAGIAEKLGLKRGEYLLTFDHAREWVLAAEAVVAMESTLLIEAMLAGSIAVNLWHDGTHVLGPSYGAREGVVLAYADTLADELERLLSDPAHRNRIADQARATASAFMASTQPGEATLRMEKLLLAVSASRVHGDVSTRSDRPGAPAVRHVWEELSNPVEADLKGQYHDHPRHELLALLERPPSRVLDVGCATGATGELIKATWPQAHVTGIELNRAAAARAVPRIDHVIGEKLEDIDFAAHGIPPGSIDTLLLADVLEHLYDPWGALRRLRPLLTEDAQVLVSLPNARNLLLLNHLASGRFPYAAEGLLDITHIRWFTREEMVKMLRETGYQVLKSARTPTAGLQELTRPAGCTTVETEKIVLKDVSDEEFEDLKALQIMHLARPLAAGWEAGEEDGPQHDFYQIWQLGHSYQKRDALWISERLESFSSVPRFHLALIVPEGGEDRLANNIKSLGHQFYSDWHLSIISAAPAHPALADMATITWIEAAPEEHLAAVNRALMERPATWVGMWEAGDKLAPHALFSYAEKADRHPEFALFNSDEDRVDAADAHSAPFFKTDFNLEMLRAAPFVVGGLLLLRHELFSELNGFDTALEGVEAYDLTLRAWEKLGHAGIGHLADVLYHRHAEGGHNRLSGEAVTEAHRRALAAHLARCGLAAELEEGLLPGSFHVHYPVAGDPLVSILVPTKNQVEMLRRCLTSLIDVTGYSNCEILVLDNGSNEAEAVAYLDELRALNSPRLQVLDCAGPFNFSAINNRGARAAQGEYLVLLNNDTAVLHPEWLTEMLGLATQADVGAVGAKLFYPDGRIQHAGVILGMNDSPADHPFIEQPAEHEGYFGRALLTQEYSAVTAACMLVRRDLYLELSGLDETRFQVSYNDVDFCLRLRQKGYRNVYTPHARLLHEGSVSQTSAVEAGAVAAKAARFAEEQNRFYDTWRHDVAYDPAYNRNLSSHGRDFLIEIAPALSIDPEWRPRPRILAHPADRYGCGEYRIVAPMRALNEAGHIFGWDTGNYLTPPELFRMEPDVILLQRQVDPHQLELIERYIRHSKAFRVYEIDDLITNIPIQSSRKKHFVAQKDLHKRFRKGVAMCHRFIVSTDYLAEAYHGYVDDIVVVPNYLERARWGELKPQRRGRAKARVGWAGSVTHDGDLAIIVDVVKATADEVDWVFFGLCPDAIRPYVAEFHKGVDLNDYPAKLASLDLDLAIAPLEDVPFNHGKSHLRLLEYGALGYPVICTDITPYRGAYPVTRVATRFKDWVDAIRAHIADRDELARRGDALRDYINANWILEDHLDEWRQAWLP
jgi:GT2 family glycosyltransferase/SAM-dependent methyltransferase/glycosyltransferase involved in cell wall biosynthesis